MSRNRCHSPRDPSRSRHPRQILQFQLIRRKRIHHQAHRLRNHLRCLNLTLRPGNHLHNNLRLKDKEHQ